MSARACQLAMLSGLRSESVRTLRWFDLYLDHDDGPMAIVAAENMKATLDRAVEFRFPLSDAAVSLLDSIEDVGVELVFPFPQRGKDGRDRPLTDMALLTQFKKATGDPEATVHGLRATFRTWMQDQVVSSDVAETCLQHEINSTSVEARYMRSDILELRRPVMQRWGQHLTDSNCGGDTGETDDPDIVSLDTFRRSG
ncbi:Prophage CP4-57 integrase [Falsiruegeria litorea R37]|uniref:Prophage CP4-57 integrase n=2 Tax=Falsiruegeria litorea TaxID=1280831 RepID=A0A1Y5RLE2_9RHOB|nr:Prophage CP4-57 integrase [Falsiruegeria litorea R37]